jgi:hypothetical protein
MSQDGKAIAVRPKYDSQNTVIVTMSQNLSRINKAGELVTFNEQQTFKSTTIREVNSHNVALWVMTVLRQFVKLARLQGKDGFKLSKPIVMAVEVNGRKLHVKTTGEESVSFKFTLSLKRIENMLDKYPELLKVAFAPTPNIGGITAGQVRDYFNGAKSLIFAKAKKDELLDAPISTEKFEEVEVVTETKPEVTNPLLDAPVEGNENA